MTADSLAEFGGDLLEADRISDDSAPATVSVPATVADGLAASLRSMGVSHALGVCGGAQALLWAAFSKHLDVLHFRHECGAAFAATEAHFALIEKRQSEKFIEDHADQRHVRGWRMV